MDRRKFLNGCLLTTTTSCLPAMAKDFSVKSEMDKIITQNKYDYSKYQLQSLSQQQESIIQNDILPRQYSESFWDQPRKIFLKRSKTNEQAEIVYFRNGQVDLQGYWHVTYLLRDIGAKLMAYPDLKLLDLLCAVQAWMKVNGNNQPLIITSGFRTKENNAKIENAARNSQHVLGKAVDFVVPGFDPKTIGIIAKHFQAGGVGIYMDQKFNHLDTGNVRSWVGHTKRK